MVTPLVEVFSVRAHNDVHDLIPRKVFGHVKVVDGFGDSYTLYDRDYDYEGLETVNGRALSLCSPRCDNSAAADEDGFTGMSPSSDVSISVDLRDASRDEIVRGTLTTSYESPDCYGEPCADRFGFATVYWTTLCAAVLATVSISCVGEEEGRSGRGFYGTLFAHYGKEYGRFCEVDKEKYFRITLFDRPRHEPAARLALTRLVLAVPAHSSVVIRGCLWDELVVVAEFAAQTCGNSSVVLENRMRAEVEFKTGQPLFQDDLGV